MSFGETEGSMSLQRCALMQPKQGLSALQYSQLTVSTACCPRDGIPRPILILRDEADGVVLPFEPSRDDSAPPPKVSVRPTRV
jgi:hypothetical protein